MGTVDYQLLEEKFFLTLNKRDNTVLTMPAIQLLDAEKMEYLIDTYGKLINTKERSAASAFFISWYAGVCAAIQHMLYRRDELYLDLSISNLSVQLYEEAQVPMFSFRINEPRFTEIAVEEQGEGYAQWLDSFYRLQVTPVIQLMSRQFSINAVPLWGQIVNALYAQMEEELGEATEEVSRTQIINVFNLLSHNVDASAFALRKNPFNIKPILIQHPTIPNEKIRMKIACCMAYCLDSEFGYCYECPRLREKDRAVMRESYFDQR